MSLQTPTAALLRMVLLTMLALGLCMQSTFAAICAIDDARSALGNDAGVGGAEAHVDDSGSAGDCCSNPMCSSCCLHSVGSLHSTRVCVASTMSIVHGSKRPDEFRARDYPVDIRPPITR